MSAPTIDQPTKAPSRKVTAAVIAGAAVYLLQALAGFGLDIPDDVAPAIEELGAQIDVLLPWVTSLVAAYITRDREQPTAA